MASCGDVPTLECLAAVALLRQHIPDVKVRVVNLVDLFKLVPQSEHPHGLSDREFEAIFTPNKTDARARTSLQLGRPGPSSHDPRAGGPWQARARHGSARDARRAGLVLGPVLLGT
jgi:hypothetical protein